MWRWREAQSPPTPRRTRRGVTGAGRSAKRSARARGALGARAEAQDAPAAATYGVLATGDSVAAARALRERLAAEQREAHGVTDAASPVLAARAPRSCADGDARRMRLNRGAYACACHAQAAVASEHGGIVATALTTGGPDVGHWPALGAAVRALRAVADVPVTEPPPLSADAGSCSGENSAEDGAGIALLIAAGRSDPAARAPAGRRYTAAVFADDVVRDVWRCPAKTALARQVTAPGATGHPSTQRSLASAVDCAACPVCERCREPGAARRSLVTQRSRSTVGLRFKLRQPGARQCDARRKGTVEPVFGQLKEDRGFTALGLRGRRLARGAWLLACLAHNLGKLLRVCPLPAATRAV